MMVTFLTSSLTLSLSLKNRPLHAVSAVIEYIHRVFIKPFALVYAPWIGWIEDRTKEYLCEAAQRLMAKYNTVNQ